MEAFITIVVLSSVGPEIAPLLSPIAGFSPGHNRKANIHVRLWDLGARALVQESLPSPSLPSTRMSWPYYVAKFGYLSGYLDPVFPGELREIGVQVCKFHPGASSQSAPIHPASAIGEDPEDTIARRL